LSYQDEREPEFDELAELEESLAYTVARLSVLERRRDELRRERELLDPPQRQRQG
jgi:hypothetical protein